MTRAEEKGVMWLAMAQLLSTYGISQGCMTNKERSHKDLCQLAKCCRNYWSLKKARTRKKSEAPRAAEQRIMVGSPTVAPAKTRQTRDVAKAIAQGPQPIGG